MIPHVDVGDVIFGVTPRCSLADCTGGEDLSVIACDGIFGLKEFNLLRGNGSEFEDVKGKVGVKVGELEGCKEPTEIICGLTSLIFKLE